MLSSSFRVGIAPLRSLTYCDAVPGTPAAACCSTARVIGAQPWVVDQRPTIGGFDIGTSLTCPSAGDSVHGWSFVRDWRRSVHTELHRCPSFGVAPANQIGVRYRLKRLLSSSHSRREATTWKGPAYLEGRPAQRWGLGRPDVLRLGCPLLVQRASAANYPRVWFAIAV